MIHQKGHATKSVMLEQLDGLILKLPQCELDELQTAVVETFVPRFAPGAQLLYLSNPAKKNPYREMDRLTQMSISPDEQNKLPDIVLQDVTRGWLFLIEAVTSHGAMTPKRVEELKEAFADSIEGCIYVSAFLSMEEFGRHLDQIAWDTEVWIAEMPDHLIHLNGDRFLGPR